MGMPLRLTFNDKDYTFQILNEKPITKQTTEIPLSLENKSIVVIKEATGWNLKEADESLNRDLIGAIGKAIELRYRL